MRKRCALLIACYGIIIIIIIIIIINTFDCFARILSASFDVLAALFRRDIYGFSSGPSGLLLHLENRSTVFVRNVGKCLPVETANISEDLNLKHFSLYLINKDPGSLQTSYRPTFGTTVPEGVE